MVSNYALFLLLAGPVLVVIQLIISSLKLRGIPGPLLASFSNVWRFRAMRSKGWADRLVTLHKTHGKLVRIGPNHISVSDPAAIPVIYSTNPVWVKGPSYFGAATVSKGRTVPSVIAMGESQHTAVRRSVGRAFTTNSLLDYEASIEAATAELVHALETHPTTDISNYLQCFAMDVLMRIAFSESLGFIEKGTDVDGILAAVMARFDHWGAWGALPGADYLFNKGPLAQRLRKKGDSPLARVGLVKLLGRKSATVQPDSVDLLHKFLDGQAKHPEIMSDNEVLGVIMSTIGAGADTTAGRTGRSCSSREPKQPSQMVPGQPATLPRSRAQGVDARNAHCLMGSGSHCSSRRRHHLRPVHTRWYGCRMQHRRRAPRRRSLRARRCSLPTRAMAGR
ncbi:hypothetical protein DL546_005736 [Coniochaeta pulveracea]|uniref:Cytochrome P450 n=1 Tax=Coniochaeta pulveracea TaxID=177199 RepID=A0A420Y443_9PEZI|nr:hypothetical protein DL546_005736 [Coniochaeta pulveracea]